MWPINSAPKKSHRLGPATAWLRTAGIALALTTGACGDGYYYDPYGYYDPYAYYVPDYLDWTYWYDDDDYWWYPYSVPGTAGRATTQTLQPRPGDDELKELKTQMAAFNVNVTNVMSPLSALVKRTPSAASGGVQTYGPADLPAAKPAATFLLTVKRLNEKKYGWHLVAKPIGADDSRYQTVLAGSMENAIAAHRGTGLAELNLDTLHAVNPAAYPGTGQISATTAAGAGGQKTLVTRLSNFSPDGIAAPTSALYAGDHTADGTYHIRWLLNAERIAAMPDRGPERVVDYLTWLPGKGGRIYTIVKNGVDGHGMAQGDLPANTYLLGQSCYAKDSTLLYKAWNSCSDTAPSVCLAAPPILVETPGRSVADCPVGSASAPPPARPTASGPTAAAPVLRPRLPARLPTAIP